MENELKEHKDIVVELMQYQLRDLPYCRNVTIRKKNITTKPPFRVYVYDRKDSGVVGYFDCFSILQNDKGTVLIRERTNDYMTYFCSRELIEFGISKRNYKGYAYVKNNLHRTLDMDNGVYL